MREICVILIACLVGCDEPTPPRATPLLEAGISLGESIGELTTSIARSSRELGRSEAEIERLTREKRELEDEIRVLKLTAGIDLVDSGRQP